MAIKLFVNGKNCLLRSFSMKCVFCRLFFFDFFAKLALYWTSIWLLLVLLEARCLFSFFNIYTLNTSWYEHVNNINQYYTYLVALYLLFGERCLVFLEFLNLQQRQIVFAFVTTLVKLQIPELWKLLPLPCFLYSYNFLSGSAFLWVSCKGLFVK